MVQTINCKLFSKEMQRNEQNPHLLYKQSKKMKTYLLVLFIACQSCVALAQDWNKTPYLTKSLSASAIKDVYVETSGGSITVSGASGESPRIEVFIHGNNGSD